MKPPTQPSRWTAWARNLRAKHRRRAAHWAGLTMLFPHHPQSDNGVSQTTGHNWQFHLSARFVGLFRPLLYRTANVLRMAHSTERKLETASRQASFYYRLATTHQSQVASFHTQFLPIVFPTRRHTEQRDSSTVIQRQMMDRTVEIVHAATAGKFSAAFPLNARTARSMAERVRAQGNRREDRSLVRTTPVPAAPPKAAMNLPAEVASPRSPVPQHQQNPSVQFTSASAWQPGQQEAWNVHALTTAVMEEMDRKLIAYRERMGRV